jgi:predicted Zn-dependent protease
MAATATVLFGDVSAVLANIPTVLLDLKYSRDIEREADDYAIAMFQANGLPRQKLAKVFEKLEQAGGGADGSVSPICPATPPTTNGLPTSSGRADPFRPRRGTGCVRQ